MRTIFKGPVWFDYKKYTPGDHHFEFVEFAPQMRTIKVWDTHQGARGGHYRPHYLSFPYMQFGLFIRYANDLPCMPHIYVTMSKTPFKNIDNPGYLVPLPNGHRDCTFCGMGYQANMQEFVAKFWNSVFVLDTSLGTRLLGQSTMLSVENWERLSKMNPGFILDPATSFGEQPPISISERLQEYGDLYYEKPTWFAKLKYAIHWPGAR